MTDIISKWFGRVIYAGAKRQRYKNFFFLLLVTLEIIAIVVKVIENVGCTAILVNIINVFFSRLPFYGRVMTLL